MSAAIMTSRGRTTIPKEIRDRLHLKPGDRLEFLLQPDGRVLMISPMRDARDLKGILPKPRKQLSPRDIDRAVGEAVIVRKTR